LLSLPRTDMDLGQAEAEEQRGRNVCEKTSQQQYRTRCFGGSKL
jgi:hypothetical protein